MSVRLRVILQEEIRKLTLPSGIPQTVGELKNILQETFAIEQDFSIQFQDQDFDGQFFSLLETKDIKDKDTIKVVLIEPVITLTFEDCLNAKGLQESTDCSHAESSKDTCSTASTIILSSPESTSSLHSESWPAQFEIPTFSFDTELILQAANEAYRKDGTLLNNPAVKSNILDKLAASIFVYTAYPSQAQREQVAEALVAKHPSLRDPVSFNGLYSWHNSLKYKLGNYRAKIEEEFRRITLKPLQSTFLGKLDQYTPQLLSLYRRKGGAVGKKLDETLDMLNEDSNIESRREVVIRGLILYLGENTGELIKDFQVFDDDDAAAVQEAITTFVLGIFVVSKARDGLPKQAGIAIEGAEVLFGIPDVAHACTYLMGLIYALELRYPNKLKYTFEVFQKIFLELEDANKKMSSKVHDLKVCLHA
uniref:uncharacterized protein LOC124053137 n=1 Tax=Scatophagus argus TaxID=75038 RepID=UPI001ED7D5A5|nr:uncharacterized protein LOC124053137 [Scatophagus argus]